MNTLYNFNVVINYLNEENENSIKIYQEGLQKVLLSDNSETFQELFTEKCDAIYDVINNNHIEIMDHLLNSVLSNDLSNNMYFYICCNSIKSLTISTTRNFNVFEYLDNNDYRKMIFGFLFNYECFQYLHSLLNCYLKHQHIDVIQTRQLEGDLSSSFIKLF